MLFFFYQVNLVILAAVVKIVTASAKLDKHGDLDHIKSVNNMK
jgi:hypothetical protein